MDLNMFSLYQQVEYSRQVLQEEKRKSAKEIKKLRKQVDGVKKETREVQEQIDQSQLQLFCCEVDEQVEEAVKGTHFLCDGLLSKTAGIANTFQQIREEEARKWNKTYKAEIDQNERQYTRINTARKLLELDAADIQEEIENISASLEHLRALRARMSLR